MTLHSFHGRLYQEVTSPHVCFLHALEQSFVSPALMGWLILAALTTEPALLRLRTLPGGASHPDPLCRWSAASAGWRDVWIHAGRSPPVYRVLRTLPGTPRQMRVTVSWACSAARILHIQLSAACDFSSPFLRCHNCRQFYSRANDHVGKRRAVRDYMWEVTSLDPDSHWRQKTKSETGQRGMDSY